VTGKGFLPVAGPNSPPINDVNDVDMVNPVNNPPT